MHVYIDIDIRLMYSHVPLPSANDVRILCFVSHGLSVYDMIIHDIYNFTPPIDASGSL